MTRYADLVAAALVGTGRASPPAPSGDAPLDGLLARLGDQSPESRLLAAAATVSLWARAGVEPRPAPSELPPPAPSDDLPPCPDRAAAHLGRMLGGNFAGALPEWLQGLAAAGCAAPHRWLPELLTLARKKGDLRPLILPVLGARGRWLAGQHAEWRGLVAPLDPAAVAEAWQTGEQTARLAALRCVRAADPAQARELAASTWREDPAAERVAFLAALADGLSMADEPFLEGALDDRSKQVRGVAADLLARLPESRLVGRMVERLRPLLIVERKRLGRAGLTVILPGECDAALVRDGVEVKPPAGIGERAWWLLQMIAAAPPSLWSDEWGRPPKELVELGGGSGQADVLLGGWGLAAARHRDGAWAEALLRRWVEQPWKVFELIQPPRLEALRGLLQAVPAERLEPWLASLARGSHPLDDDHPLLALLSRHQRVWGKDLTRAVLELLRRLAGQRQRVWRWQAALPALALYAAPDLAEEAERGWPDQSYWRQNVDTFVLTLRFRREVREALGVGA